MGHLAAKKPYLDLQRRLDKMPIGAPAHRAFFRILEELFTEEECRLAAGMPLRPARLEEVAGNAEIGERRARELLETLVEKGLVVDLPLDGRPTRYFLNPAVIGFFEFSMMRVRPEIDQRKVAELMWEYLKEDPKLGFMRMLTGGETFIGRPLVNEQTLEPDIYAEILDWEKATTIVDEAKSWAEGICHCRHVKLHLGQRCDFPLDHCLTLGRGAEYLVRAGIAKRIDRERAREILDYAREHGAVQMADNVRNRPSYICNCCKCCCEMMGSFRTLPDYTKVVSSNFVAVGEAEACTGCGKCAEACPIDAIEMVPAEPTQSVPKRKKRASIDAPRCLGCGVCHTFCDFGGIRLVPAEQRVYTPEDMLERAMLQAVERGTLQNLLFNDPSKLTHRSLAAALRVIAALPPIQARLARGQLKSKFVGLMLDRIRSSAGRGVKEARA